jgi:hypothetical protein
MVEAGGGDHWAGGAGSGDEDLGVVAEERLGEGNQGAYVAGPATGADQDAHEEIRRAPGSGYSRAAARRREYRVIAMATPAASISTSTGVPWRPSTNDWWSSSEAA